MAKRIRKQARAERITEEQMIPKAASASQIRARKIVANAIALLALGQVFGAIACFSSGLDQSLCLWFNNLGPAQPGEYFVPADSANGFAGFVALALSVSAVFLGGEAAERVMARILGGYSRELIQVQLSERGVIESQMESFWRAWNWALLPLIGWVILLIASVGSYARVSSSGLVISRWLIETRYSWSKVSDVAFDSRDRTVKGRATGETSFFYVVTFRDDSTWETPSSDSPYWHDIKRAMEFADSRVEQHRQDN